MKNHASSKDTKNIFGNIDLLSHLVCYFCNKWFYGENIISYECGVEHCEYCVIKLDLSNCDLIN